jgi:EmrB/QacA subfamily drug resistance transporter
MFTAGSALCGAAPSLALLIAARVVQGIGGSLLMAVSPAMLTAAFPPNERGRALGWNSTIVAAGITAGPVLGGLITAQASWRWIFYVNVPIGVAGAVATSLVLPADHRASPTRFDVPGAVLLGVALASLTSALSIGNEVGWGSPYVLGLGAATVTAVVLFVVRELRFEAPLLDHRLFQDRLFAWAVISLVLSFLAAFAVSFLMPFYFEQLRGFGVAKTGLLLTAFPVVIAVVAPISGGLADRFGTRGLAAAGMAILCVGLVMLARLDDTSSEWAVIAPQLVTALGMGLFQSPNNSAVMGAAPRDRQGVAAGMLATGRTMGQSISVAIGGAVFTSLGAATAGRAILQHPGDPALAAAFLHGYRWALLTCASIAALAIVTSLLRGNDRRPRAS